MNMIFVILVFDLVGIDIKNIKFLNFRSTIVGCILLYIFTYSENLTCNMTVITMGRNATGLVEFDDGAPSLTFQMNNNTISFLKVYNKSGYYQIKATIVEKSISSTFMANIIASAIFDLKCDSTGNLGEYVSCIIIDIMSNANVGLLIDFGDGEQRMLYLVNDDIKVEKIFATEGNYTIKAQSIDKYLNKQSLNATIQITGGRHLIIQSLFYDYFLLPSKKHLITSLID